MKESIKNAIVYSLVSQLAKDYPDIMERHGPLFRMLDGYISAMGESLEAAEMRRPVVIQLGGPK